MINSKKKINVHACARCFAAFALLALSLLAAAGCDRRAGRLEILIGDESLRDYVSLERDSVTMYASPEDRKAGKAECRVYRNEYDVFTRMFRVLDDRGIRAAYLAKGARRFPDAFVARVRVLDDGRFRPGPVRARPLAGLRIAIDPGHNAGTMDEAIREEKYMWIFTPDGRRLKFFEAALNLATARILKQMLEADGAEVMLTRDTNRQVFPVPYDRWVRRNFRAAVIEKMRDRFITPEAARFLLCCAGDKRRMRFFNSEYDMPFRARLINGFRPHISVIVHYNATGSPAGYQEKYARILDVMKRRYASNAARAADLREVMQSIATTDRDFSTVFVPGWFLRHELDTVESRVEFMRLIIGDDLDRSVRFSACVLDGFRRYLKVPRERGDQPGGRRVGLCRNGLYARNFRMTRLVRGPLCLGEPLQQNFMEEALKLADISNGKIPERVAATARAYHEAIRLYVRQHPDEL